MSATAATRARRQIDPVHPVLPYFVLTFAWTWSLWWTAAATGSSFSDPLGFMLFMTGGLGPLVGAAWVAHRRGPAYRRHFLRRIWDPRRIPARWWLAVAAVAAGPAVLGAAVASAAGTAATVPRYSVGAVAAVVVFALAAGLVEEPGWRGAASDAWQRRTRPVWAATGIGALWALWHLPLNLIEGTYYHSLGLGSLRFWLANLVLIQLGVLYVWLVNGSGGSILMAILAHAGFNIAGELVPSSTTRDVIALLVVTAATAAVMAATKGRLRFAAADSHQPHRRPAGQSRPGVPVRVNS